MESPMRFHPVFQMNTSMVAMAQTQAMALLETGTPHRAT